MQISSYKKTSFMVLKPFAQCEKDIIQRGKYVNGMPSWIRTRNRMTG